jgi:hypothetical protein
MAVRGCFVGAYAVGLSVFISPTTGILYLYTCTRGFLLISSKKIGLLLFEADIGLCQEQTQTCRKEQMP